MSDPSAKIQEVLARALADLSAVSTPDALEQFRIKYLGSNGEVKNLMQLIKTAAPEQKKLVGAQANNAKEQIQTLFDQRKQQIAGAGQAGRDAIDVTEPGARPGVGNRHILMQVIDELTDLFARMGFAVAEGP